MNDDSFGFSGFLAFFREKNKFLIVIGALILGGCLIFLSNGDKRTEGYDYDGAVQVLEERVVKLCDRMRGVSEASVMITLDTVGETKYAQNSQMNKDESNVNTRYEYVSDSGGLLPIAEVTPKVRGIAVVCRGGGNPDIQLKLTELLSALFGIPSSAVSVAEGK